MTRVLSYFVYTALLLPIIFVLGASFTAGGYIRFPPDGLSFRWYVAMWNDADMMKGLLISLYIALITTVISLVIGTMAALYLVRLNSRGRQLMASLFLSPLSVPMVLTGFAMLVIFTQLGLVNGTGLVISHVVVTVPYILRTVMASLSLTDPFIPRAAAILGADPWRVFWYVVMPILKPGMLAGGMFTFLASFNNITISVFISSPGASPLPVVIFNRMENLAEPSAAAAATAVILLTAVGILILEQRFSLFKSLLGSTR
jgi:putative spermidine/putrescine transport system permease protein